MSTRFLKDISGFGLLFNLKAFCNASVIIGPDKVVNNLLKGFAMNVCLAFECTKLYES